MRIKIDDLNREEFKQGPSYVIPREFFADEKYKGLSSNAKITYEIFIGLIYPCAEHECINENGEIYLPVNREKLMHDLNIKAENEMNKVIKELKNANLIDEEAVHGVKVIYVHLIG